MQNFTLKISLHSLIFCHMLRAISLPEKHLLC